MSCHIQPTTSSSHLVIDSLSTRSRSGPDLLPKYYQCTHLMEYIFVVEKMSKCELEVSKIFKNFISDILISDEILLKSQ